MLPTEGREHFFKKANDVWCKKKFKAWKAQRKQQIVYEIDKTAGVMHTLIFADEALGGEKCTALQPET